MHPAKIGTNINNRKDARLLLKVFFILTQPPNGVRYPLVGGARQRHFDGANFKPRKLLKNAQTPTRRVHAVLGASMLEDFFAL